MSSDATMLEGIGEYKFGFSDPDTTVFKSKKGLDRVEEISEMKGSQTGYASSAESWSFTKRRCLLGEGFVYSHIRRIYFYVKQRTTSKSWDDVPSRKTPLISSIPSGEEFLTGLGHSTGPNGLSQSQDHLEAV
jgi:Fe-S cluster assembly protein SufB